MTSSLPLPERLPAGAFADAVRGYLDTPTMGVPPLAAVERLRAALADWQAARADYLTWEADAEACRAAFAVLLGVRPADVALVPSVVPAAQAAAAALAPRGGKLLAHRAEYRSGLLPAMVAYGEGRVRWVDGPYTAGTFLAALDADVSAVLVAAVASHDGGRPDLARLAGECARTGRTAMLVNATQAAGIVGLGVPATQLALVAAAGYKGLLAPRGGGYAYADPELLPGVPAAASPYGMADAAAAGAYGPPVLPRPGAGRLNQSPVWFAWVAALPALQLLAAVPAADRERHATALAGRLRDGLARAGLAAQDTDLPSPVVSVAASDPDRVVALLAQAGVRAAARRGRIRLGFHLYNTRSDADAALEVLASRAAQPLLRPARTT